jgi:hypothetical protein
MASQGFCTAHRKSGFRSKLAIEDNDINILKRDFMFSPTMQ